MSKPTTHVGNVKTAIRRLRALASEIDRAVKAAAQVRRELSERAANAPALPFLASHKSG